MYKVEILADSVGPTGIRLITYILEYPRIIHPELLTHRLFSRNASSSRAIPIAKIIERVQTDPVLPRWWGKNQSGMQAREEISESDKPEAIKRWLEARDSAVEHAKRLADLGLHKQIVNRVLEPWSFITVLLSGTSFDNWFYLRDSEQAQPEIAWLAREMRRKYEASQPERKYVGEWHLPFIKQNEWWQDIDDLKKINTGRCARISYLTHDGKRDPAEDIALHDRLAAAGHWSPFEHAAVALSEPAWIGNFQGWKQYRKFFPAEHAGGAFPAPGNV